jgi:hypothetical protein
MYVNSNCFLGANGKDAVFFLILKPMYVRVTSKERNWGLYFILNLAYVDST